MEKNTSKYIPDSVNKKLRRIWREAIDEDRYPKKLRDPLLWPLQYPSMEKGHMLFIGLNPAYNKKDKEDRAILELGSNPLKKLGEKSQSWEEVYKRESRVIEEAHKGKSPLRYFDWFHSEFEDVGWNHVDLFAMRHTGQDKFLGAMKIAKDGEHPDAKFVREQFKVAMELIRNLKPPVVTVVNAQASRVILKRFEKRPKSEWMRNEEDGFYVERRGAVDTPWLFSGPVSGQGQIDNFSKRRLKWHIEQAMAWSQDRNK